MRTMAARRRPRRAHEASAVMTRRGVIFDLVAAQSPSYRGRGISRYSTELVRAMVQYHPELVSSIVVHPELGPTEGTEDLSEWLTTSPDWAEGSVLHMSSVIEPEVPVRVYWPREASAHRLYTAVTLYDLIPELFPGWYLQDPGLRRRWRCCLEVVRQADASADVVRFDQAGHDRLARGARGACRRGGRRRLTGVPSP